MGSKLRRLLGSADPIHQSGPARIAGTALVVLTVLLFGVACGSSPHPAAQRAAPSPAPPLTEGQLQEKYLAQRNEGRSLLERKQYGRALDAFLSANAIRPNAPDTLLGIGKCYAGLEYYEKAREYWDRFVELDREHDGPTYFMIAGLYWTRLGLPDAAIRLLTTAIGQSTDPAGGRYYLLRGNIYAATGKADAARADLTEARTLGLAAKNPELVAEAEAALAKLDAQ
ncbi:MAG TPA: tetratricopeptide repeat protein [Rectinemataceae bacterium]|nr:tetratricopeptide repeat protein [Rectinemataceae bacterium]